MGVTLLLTVEGRAHAGFELILFASYLTGLGWILDELEVGRSVVWKENLISFGGALRGLKAPSGSDKLAWEEDSSKESLSVPGDTGLPPAIAESPIVGDWVHEEGVSVSIVDQCFLFNEFFGSSLRAALAVGNLVGFLTTERRLSCWRIFAVSSSWTSVVWRCISTGMGKGRVSVIIIVWSFKIRKIEMWQDHTEQIHNHLPIRSLTK